MRDSFSKGVAKILLGKGASKETAFLDVTPIHLEVSVNHRLSNEWNKILILPLVRAHLEMKVTFVRLQINFLRLTNVIQ